MITVSLCMIVKNEEAVLGRCLDSVRNLVEEIIIVDTGSSDDTKAIAAKYTEKVFDFKWIDDFSAARNFAFSKGKMDYLMWLDADDIFPCEDAKSFLALKQTLSNDTDIVTMKYHTHFDRDGNPVLTSTRERLIKRGKNFFWQDPVHECIPLAGKIFYSDICIHHKKIREEGISFRNLRIYEALEASGKPMTPRQQYYFARELKDHGKYEKAAMYFAKFLDGGMGWEEDNIAACHALALCETNLGNEPACFAALVRSFTYSPPRAEICSELGYYYKRAGEYQKALDWFDLAPKLPPKSMGFVLHGYAGYIPYIEACVCASRLGKLEIAYKYNEAAGKIRSDDASYLHNKKYLSALLKKE